MTDKQQKTLMKVAPPAGLDPGVPTVNTAAATAAATAPATAAPAAAAAPSLTPQQERNEIPIPRELSTQHFQWLLLGMMVLKYIVSVWLNHHLAGKVNFLSLRVEVMFGVFFASAGLEFYFTDGKLYESVSECFGRKPLWDTLRMGIPPLLLMAQTISTISLLAHLEMIPLELSQEGRLIATAVLSMFLLQRTFTLQQWISMSLMLLGLFLTHTLAYKMRTSSITIFEEQGYFLYGVFFAVLANAFGGASLVLIEKYVKNPHVENQHTSLWMRSMQLSFFNVVLFLFENALIVLVIGGIASSPAPWSNKWVWVLLLVDIFGELLFVVILKYADSVQLQVCFSLGVALSYLMQSIWVTEIFAFWPSFFGAIITVACAYYFFVPVPACSRERILQGYTYEALQTSGGGGRGRGVLLVPPGLDSSVTENLLNNAQDVELTESVNQQQQTLHPPTATQQGPPAAGVPTAASLQTT